MSKTCGACAPRRTQPPPSLGVPRATYITSTRYESRGAIRVRNTSPGVGCSTRYESRGRVQYEDTRPQTVGPGPWGPAHDPLPSGPGPSVERHGSLELGRSGFSEKAQWWLWDSGFIYSYEYEIRVRENTSDEYEKIRVRDLSFIATSTRYEYEYE